MPYTYDVALSFATEEQKMVDTIYHYLKSEGLKVFFAPECQETLAGMNQREIFYQIFAKLSEHVILFVSENYIVKDVPMEEANIAIKNHESGFVLPIYLDNSQLPTSIWNAKEKNYFRSCNPVEITKIIIASIRNQTTKKSTTPFSESLSKSTTENTVFTVNNNTAMNQQIIGTAYINGKNCNG